MSARKRSKPGLDDPSFAKRQSSSGSDASPIAWTHRGVQVLLPADQRLVFTGRGMLAVQSGEIAVGGATLSASSGAVELTGEREDGGAVLIEVVATEARLPLAGSGGAAFSIASSTPGSSQRDPSFTVHLEDDPDAPVAMEVPLAWQQAAADVAASIAAGTAVGAPPAVIAVYGAKKVGKSSFAKYLINVLLSSSPLVAYLDTDCGQPEFTPPGLLSLSLLRSPVLGPPHCHLRPPQAAHFFGDVSPQCDPAYFLRCVTSLRDWHAAHSAAAGGQGAPPPLVINTCGWVKGLGYDVLVDTLRALPLTHAVHLTSANPRKDLPEGIFWGVEGQPPPPVVLWQVPGAASQGMHSTGWPSSLGHRHQDDLQPRSSLSAVDLRGLLWAAFARACVAAAPPPPATPGNGAAAQQEGAAAEAEAAGEVGDLLAATAPLVVDFAEVQVRVLHASVPQAELPRVLNSAIVGLCCATAPGASHIYPCAQLPQHGQADPMPCLGLGIVRAVDAQSGRIWVLTDVGEEAVQVVDCLQVGRLELPPALLQTGRHLSPYLALHSLATAGTGAGASKSRNNLLRAGQL